MTGTVEIEVSDLAVIAHEQLSQIDDYNEIVSDNLEDMILQLYRQAEQQSDEVEDADLEAEQ